MIKRTDRVSTAVLEMCHAPVNALDTQFSLALAEELGAALDDPAVKGVVLTGTGAVFCAGVDLLALLSGGATELPGFLDALDRLFRVLRGAAKPMVACVNGHAIAGGCVLALGCDYRVLAGGGAKIGLPELRVGVPFPSTALEIVRAAVPRRHVREVVLLGALYGPEAALARGLADELAPETDALPRSLEVARCLAEIPESTYRLTKRALSDPGGGARSPEQIDTLNREVEAVWADEETHRHIRRYVERTLGKRV